MVAILFVSIPVLAVMLLLVLNALADEGVFFTKTKEGTAQAVMRGNTFVKMIISWKGKVLNEFGEVVEGAQAIPFLGWRWVGIWPFYKVHVYPFIWTETKTDQKTGEVIKRPRDEKTNFIYVLKVPYVSVVMSAETLGNVPVDIDTMITIKVINPYQALFGVSDYLQRIMGVIDAEIKNFVGGKTYEEILEDRDENVIWSYLKEKLSDRFVINDNKIFMKEYGIVVYAAEILQIEISGTTSESLREASTQKFVAQAKADATIAIAKGEADATRIKASAEADAMKKIATAEALRIKRKAKTVTEMGSAGNQVLQAQRDEELGKQGNTIVLGGRSDDIVTPTAASLLKGDKK